MTLRIFLLRFCLRFLSSLAKRATVETTPYSDKHYQPIISKGILGIDKLVLPHGFVAKNQDFTCRDPSLEPRLYDIVDSFKAPISAAIGYGLGVFPQAGYEDTSAQDRPQIDFINVVENLSAFHDVNLHQHPQHYSFKNHRIIRLIQGANGIYFNPFVSMKDTMIKYGVISVEACKLDLCEWSSLYFAGRLQKPVAFMKDDAPFIKFLNQYNLKNAMTLLVLLLHPNEFSEKNLYEQITRISYLGDFRMYVGGENPNKIQNIVERQYAEFKQLYEPIIDYLVAKNCLIITDTRDNVRTFRKNLTIPNKIKLISALPLQFRARLYQMNREKSIKEIVNDVDLAKKLTRIVTRTIRISSLKQAVRGVLSLGVMKSVRYAFAKLLKFWNGLLVKQK